jgi:3-oxoacyl-[acyl-carrier-protein] synthase II
MEDNMKRVVVTGFGTINPTGNTASESWENLKNGVNGIADIDEEIFELTGIRVAGQIKNFDAKEYLDAKLVRTLDRVTQLGIVASREAYNMANLDEVEDRFRIGTNVTSGIGGMQSLDENILVARNRGFNKITPQFIPKSLINLVGGNIAIDLNARGINNAIVTACASSTDAIGHAYSYIKSGMVDVMITGGAEATVIPIGIAGFNNMKALSKSQDKDYASIPFDENRNGFVMGEGAGTLILEDYDHAVARGATIYGEVVGYGASCDASHITAPDAEAVASSYALEMALRSANVPLEEVGYVNAHGTSTPLNDKTEVAMLKKTFKEHAANLHVTSSKSMTGHLLGAAGAIEGMITMLSIQEGVVTPTINTKTIAEECQGVKIAQELVKDETLKYGISTSLGFGGHNAVVVFKKFEG